MNDYGWLNRVMTEANLWPMTMSIPSCDQEVIALGLVIDWEPEANVIHAVAQVPILFSYN